MAVTVSIFRGTYWKNYLQGSCLWNFTKIQGRGGGEGLSR